MGDVMQTALRMYASGSRHAGPKMEAWHPALRHVLNHATPPRTVTIARFIMLTRGETAFNPLDLSEIRMIVVRPDGARDFDIQAANFIAEAAASDAQYFRGLDLITLGVA